MKVIGKTLKHYRNLGYIVNVNETITIDVEHLTQKSRSKIIVECDVCGFQKQLPYQKYTKNIDSYGYYACSQKCSVNKCKLTLLDNFGVDRPMKNIDIKNQFIKTCMRKYGVENPMQLNQVKEKTRNTNLLKYGVESSFNVPEFKEKSKITMYKKYGVYNAMMNEEVSNKTVQTKIKNGINLPDNAIIEFLLYKRNVNRITRRNKKELYSNWDGYDYYDGEYIKENTSLNFLDRKFPTIDHKISIFNGFLNKLDFKIIGDIDNLCITKKYINSIKGKNKIFEDIINLFNC